MRDFTFVRPGNEKELLEIKGREGEQALILAGGSNLMVYIKEGSINAGTLVDITGLPGLRGIRLEDGRVEIGACETIASILACEPLRRALPFFPEALGQLGNPLVRNKATIGGNIADASPIADAAPPLLVLGAELLVASLKGEKTLPLDGFFLGPRRTRLGPEEAILKIRFPLPPRGRGCFLKLGLRRGTACAVTSVAVWMVARGGKAQDIRIALGGVAPVPLRAKLTESLFKNSRLEPAAIESLAREVAGELDPIDDVRGSAAYRKEVTIRLLARAVKQACALGD